MAVERVGTLNQLLHTAPSSHFMTPPLVHLHFILVAAVGLAPILHRPLLPCILTLYKVTLQPFPWKDPAHFPHPLSQGWPRDLLWPIQYSRHDNVPIPSFDIRGCRHFCLLSSLPPPLHKKLRERAPWRVRGHMEESPDIPAATILD